MILETERLFLREMKQSDFHSLCKILQDEVCSIIRDTNTASQNVAKRNGMIMKDTWTKHYKGVDMPHYRYKSPACNVGIVCTICTTSKFRNRLLRVNNERKTIVCGGKMTQ